MVLANPRIVRKCLQELESTQDVDRMLLTGVSALHHFCHNTGGLSSNLMGK
jgi:hypothetical protein